MKEPEVNIGIMTSKEIKFSLNNIYYVNGEKTTGNQVVSINNGKINWNNNNFTELIFTPANYTTSSFELKDVTIGINFHWERKENQKFQGRLKFVIENDLLRAINIILIEDYLKSVISSEMSATASLELLKAHAVISRSWILAQITKKGKNFNHENTTQKNIDKNEYIKWYDKEDHNLFDVCADDHCQRYQGITKASTNIVLQAIEETAGEVLTYGDEICDARFSKCCGGALEEFRYCWEEKDVPYLRTKRDLTQNEDLPNLENENEAEKWINSSPESFCNTNEPRILSQILNNYDQETTDFYRWKVSYSQTEISDIIKTKTGKDFGDIIDIEPISRGKSGRLWKIRIIGSKHSMIIGKELEIRKTLSRSHLYSSAFIIKKEGIQNNIPQKFILTGAGWGHGVGLCQIGAAVMGEQGYNYKEILQHYYINSMIKTLYKHEHK